MLVFVARDRLESLVFGEGVGRFGRRKVYSFVRRQDALGLTCTVPCAHSIIAHVFYVSASAVSIAN